MSGEQTHALNFLSVEFGEAVTYGYLPGHPIRQEMMMSNDDIIADYREVKFLIKGDGSFGPLLIGDGEDDYCSS